MATAANVFTPGLSCKLTLSTTSAATAIAGGPTCVIYNPDSAIVAIVAFGDSSVVAVQPDATPTANRHAIAPGSTQAFTMGNATHIAAKSESGTPALHITRGDGC
jgi:hypothetical protein